MSVRGDTFQEPSRGVRWAVKLAAGLPFHHAGSHWPLVSLPWCQNWPCKWYHLSNFLCQLCPKMWAPPYNVDSPPETKPSSLALHNRASEYSVQVFTSVAVHTQPKHLEMDIHFTRHVHTGWSIQVNCLPSCSGPSDVVSKPFDELSWVFCLLALDNRSGNTYGGFLIQNILWTSPLGRSLHMGPNALSVILWGKS